MVVVVSHTSGRAKYLLSINVIVSGRRGRDHCSKQLWQDRAVPGLLLPARHAQGGRGPVQRPRRLRSPQRQSRSLRQSVGGET